MRKRMDRVPAKICAVCPLCVDRRHWPDSRHARIMRALERRCPFCRAYDRVRAQTSRQERLADRRGDDPD